MVQVCLNVRVRCNNGHGRESSGCAEGMFVLRKCAVQLFVAGGGRRQADCLTHTDSHHNGHNKMIFAESYV